MLCCCFHRNLNVSLYIVSLSVIWIAVAAALAVLITAVILWVVRRKRAGVYSEFTDITTDKSLKISDLKYLEIGISFSFIRNLLRCDVKYVMWSNVCLEWTVIYKLTRKCIICIRILLDFYNSSFAFFLLVSYHKYSHYFSDKREGTNDSVVSIIISMTHGWYISWLLFCL